MREIQADLLGHVNKPRRPFEDQVLRAGAQVDAHARNEHEHTQETCTKAAECRSQPHARLVPRYSSVGTWQSHPFCTAYRLGRPLACHSRAWIDCLLHCSLLEPNCSGRLADLGAW